MPMYDVRCSQGHVGEVLAAWQDKETPCRTCGAPTERIWIAGRRAVLGDAMDYIDDNLGPHPIHITSRAQRKTLMAKAGLQERIRHVDGDRHASRWI